MTELLAYSTFAEITRKGLLTVLGYFVLYLPNDRGTLSHMPRSYEKLRVSDGTHIQFALCTDCCDRSVE